MIFARMLAIALYFLSNFLFANYDPKSPMIVRHPAPESSNDKRWLYDTSVIELCLSKTLGEFGPYKLVFADPMNQTRIFDKLRAGKLIDVVAVTSTREREKEVTVIPHSIHKEMMGIKLFLIRKESQADFDKIKTLEDLKRLSGGQQQDWADSEIMRYNGLTIKTGSNYEGLFKMLEKGRFDYFPRSLPEVFEELEARPGEDIVVERSIALVYSMPSFLFVNKNNHALARRLKRGMEIAIADGSFEALFQKKHSESIRRLNLESRRVFFLNNPIHSQYWPFDGKKIVLDSVKGK